MKRLIAIVAEQYLAGVSLLAADLALGVLGRFLPLYTDLEDTQEDMEPGHRYGTSDRLLPLDELLIDSFWNLGKIETEVTTQMLGIPI